MENTTANDRAAVQFVLGLARALHNTGSPSHQVEDVLGTVAARLNVRMQFLATPTSIMVSHGPFDDQRIILVRLDPGEQDLGRLSAVFNVARIVMRGELTPAEGLLRLDEAERFPPRYNRLVTVMAMGLSSAAAARFLDGGGHEIVVAGICGLVLGLLAVLGGRFSGVRRMFEPMAAMVAAILTGAAAYFSGPLAISVATLAGIIILLPGYSLTVAITELSNKHLVAGTARLAGAITTFLLIAIGVAIGSQLIDAVLGTTNAGEPHPLPGWTLLAALFIAPLGFTVLLKAQPRAFPWILATCLAGFTATRLGSQLLGAELGVFFGALVVGLAGSAYFWINGRPPAVVRVPGILLLVPGSVGFRSLTALLDQQVLSGVETAFKMMTMASALAAGLLIASVAAPTRITRGT